MTQQRIVGGVVMAMIAFVICTIVVVTARILGEWLLPSVLVSISAAVTLILLDWATSE